MKFKLKTTTEAIHDTRKEKLKRHARLGFRYAPPFGGAPEMYNGVLHLVRDDTLTVNIDTLEELVEFIDANGRITISKDTIIIFEDWPEMKEPGIPGSSACS